MRLSDALGRIAAEDIIAEDDLVPYARSAMDGYALRSADTESASPDAPVGLPVAGKVFTGEGPGHARSRYCTWNYNWCKAKVERRMARAYGFHLFRHSAGSQMHEATGDLKQTQSFLGHSGISVTGDVYVHLQPDSEVESMQKLEEALLRQRVVLNCVQKRG